MPGLSENQTNGPGNSAHNYAEVLADGAMNSGLSKFQHRPAYITDLM